MSKKKIAIVTATRAEYGLLIPLIKRIDEDDSLDLDLIATGTHLSDSYGYTVDEIHNDGFKVTHEIPILDPNNTPYGVSVTMANAIRGFAKCFTEDRPDLAVILGDRTEMLGVASAALNCHIPIAHIHGGEITEGAVDDCIRHAITKMSSLHFTSTETYRKRVIQMGEAPERVFNVGALGVENILNQNLIDNSELRRGLGIPDDAKYAVVTYHPVTMEDDTIRDHIMELCNAMDCKNDLFFLITGSNADSGGFLANSLLKEYARDHTNAVFSYNLGMRKYLSSVKNAAFVLGNSSSGIIEAPALGTPTVNVGNRQNGRIMADTVICCDPTAKTIVEAISKALITKHEASHIYGDGRTSIIIHNIIMRFLSVNNITYKMRFFDL